MTDSRLPLPHPPCTGVPANAPPGARPRLLCQALAVWGLTAWPLASVAAPPALTGVGVLKDHNEAAQVAQQLPVGVETNPDWSGTAGAEPRQLLLAASAWGDASRGRVPRTAGGPQQPEAPPEAARAEQSQDRALLLAASAWREARPIRSPVAGTRRGRSPSTAEGPPQPEVLLLDMVINGQRKPDVVRAEQWPDGALLLNTSTWSDARLAPLAQIRTLSDGSAGYALDAVPGATYRINRQKLSLEINAPATAFIGSTLGLQGENGAAPPRPQPGVLLNYDASVQRGANGGPTTGGAALEAVAFTGIGNFVHSALLNYDGMARSFARLDTFWRYDMPERLETLVVGDTVGTGGGWSRPARYGGIRWGRDFGMRPGFVTLPQISVSGEAALPSTVEVLVNNARRLSQPVPPGPFELTNVPVITGAGELNLVVRDLLGRETVVRQSYYASPRLLAPGLTDFSIEGGRLRSGYGRESHYGGAFGAFTGRQGLSNSLTGEARVEVQTDRRAAGVELASLLGQWGVGRLALAASTDNAQGPRERGQMLQLGVERSTPRGGGAVQYENSSRGFAPFGEGQGATVAPLRARERWLASIGGNVWRQVSGGISYVYQSRWDGDRVQLLGLSASTPVGSRASLSLSLNKRLDGDHAWRAGVTLSIPLDDRLYTSARVERASNGKLTTSASASRNAPAGPGLGWRVEGSSQESQRARGSLQYNTSQAEFALDASSDASGHVALRGGARGTLGMMAGMPFASRPVGQGSFALVLVEGMAGVPIKRSHQVVAETDARGLAFIPGLLPWQQNQIEVDPTNLPMDTELGELVQQVTPFAGSGAVVKFAVRRTLQALVVLHKSDGTPVPVGTRVRLLPSGAEFTAGRRGEVWLTDLAAEQQRLRVSWATGGCELVLAVPASDGTPAKIGPLACTKE